MKNGFLNNKWCFLTNGVILFLAFKGLNRFEFICDCFTSPLGFKNVIKWRNGQVPREEAECRLCLEVEESAFDDLEGDEQNPFLGIEFLISGPKLSETGIDAQEMSLDCH